VIDDPRVRTGYLRDIDANAQTARRRFRAGTAWFRSVVGAGASRTRAGDVGDVPEALVAVAMPVPDVLTPIASHPSRAPADWPPAGTAPASTHRLERCESTRVLPGCSLGRTPTGVHAGAENGRAPRTLLGPGRSERVRARSGGA